MSIRRSVKWIGAGIACGIATAAAGYATIAAVTWLRYGHPGHPQADEADPLLEQFMPDYDVVERHRIRVDAPAEVTLAAAAEMDMQQSPVIRAIFSMREKVLGAKPDRQPRPRGLVALTSDLGWGKLAELPGREIVMGAVTQPWNANVVFRALPPDRFAAFNEPNYVKIVWTLRADPISATASEARTETRVIATDPIARGKFRRYWACVSPGIVCIRWISLRLIKQEAEHRVRAVPPQVATQIPRG